MKRLLFLILVCASARAQSVAPFILGGAAAAAPAADSVKLATSAGSGATTGSTGVTFNYTVSSQTNRLLTFQIQYRDGDATTAPRATAASFNAVAATLLNRGTTNNAADKEGEDVWYLVNPASGLHQVSVTTDSSMAFSVVVTEWYNVNQTTPVADWTTESRNESDVTIAVPNCTANRDIVVASRVERYVTEMTISTGTQLWSVARVAFGDPYYSICGYVRPSTTTGTIVFGTVEAESYNLMAGFRIVAVE